MHLLVASSRFAGWLVLKYTCAVVRFAQLAEKMSEKANIKHNMVDKPRSRT